MKTGNLIGLLLFLFSTPVISGERDQWSTALGFERWDDEKSPAHGIVMLAYDRSGLPHNARVGLLFNTDTLRFEYDGHRLSPTVEFGGRFGGEYAIANLLSDYFKEGQNDPARTFSASYLQAQTWLKWNPLHRTYVTAEFGARKWFFGRRDETDEAFTLPLDAWVVEPRLHLVWWGLDDDLGWHQRHRFFPHLSGISIGATLGLNYQPEVRDWGARNVAAFGEIDPRNSPESVQWQLIQWVRAGYRAGQSLRLELEQELGWMSGEDDLSRRPVGGMTPYSVNLPGVPWAYFHSGRYVSARFSLHWTIVDGLELGPLVSGVGLRDVDRVGASDISLIWGAGGLLAWRTPQWQVDLRGGLSPALTSHHPEQEAWSVLLFVGWGGP